MLYLNFHTDPGHGWLEVPVAELVKYGLLDKITPFSYVNGSRAFLEEDLDANQYLKKLTEAGIKFELKYLYKDNTPIRNYASFRF